MTRIVAFRFMARAMRALGGLLVGCCGVEKSDVMNSTRSIVDSTFGAREQVRSLRLRRFAAQVA
jgi:hypothetical protein